MSALLHKQDGPSRLNTDPANGSAILLYSFRRMA
jgi:hypothetical protein